MIDTNARTTAKQRVHELSYGKDRDDKDELLTVLDKIAAEWQADKNELDSLRAQLWKSEEWGAEMKRLANEQADLANTWMTRCNEARALVARHEAALLAELAKEPPHHA